ncbi:sensor histidine kinase [Halobacillus litoralis]|uniref:sensor histidine kinase n=1 Tax=Halobacillus litoralis TaxID=45668 RepID=UPI001CD51961|nr:sensor histidine kinase [Halobacillus litoralis]MCA0972114.1 sensor histidine kinase [Halobacillus litoralis]
MMPAYLREKMSWIVFIGTLQGFLLLLSALDATIPFESVLYYVFLSTSAFLVFLFVRYKRESAFYQQLKERVMDQDVTSIPEGLRPFEKIVETTLKDEMHQLQRRASTLQRETEEEKDELLAWIHEVKTPLTAMDLMLQDIEDPELKQPLKYEWLRIHLLLEQQLHQKRLPFMEKDIYMEQVDLKPLLFNEIKTLQSWCRQKGIGIEIDLEETTVLTDAKWVTFLIRQLLTNAVKYSENADIHITSSLQNQHVHFAIQDFGRGIDPSDLPRIFEKGFTSTSHHHDSNSTGMGLYLADRIARTLKIDLQIESQLHKGTTATLTFSKPNDFTEQKNFVQPTTSM